MFGRLQKQAGNQGGNRSKNLGDNLGDNGGRLQNFQLRKLLVKSGTLLAFVAFNLLIQLLLSTPLQSQNLILNPGFELSDDCPWQTDQLGLATNWSRPTDGTSDYLHSCAISSLVSVPGNGFGWQNAAEGNAYAGIISWVDASAIPDFANYREYITGELAEPLIAGTRYKFEVKVNRAEGFRFACDKFGVWFADSNFSLPSTGENYYALSNHGINPQLSLTGAEFVDTLDWTLLSGTYYASGGERFLTIGNFSDDDASNAVEMNSGAAAPLAYYYLDDLKLVADNAPPVASDDFGELYPGETVAIETMENDFDPEGALDPASLLLLDLPLQGSASFSDEGWLNYTATDGFVGLDSMVYLICDFAGLCDEASVRVMVKDPVRPADPVIFDVEPPIALEELLIPNVITPNGDGFNETFTIVGLEDYPNNELLIFNRWGSTVFKQEQYENTWAGRWQRKDVGLPDGTYFYLLRIEVNGEIVRMAGDITIYR